MIGVGDLYKVVEAMAPLYLALALGYGSVRWWQIFKPAECDTINRLVAYFAFPFFAFQFTLHCDPFTMNYRAILADIISKAIIIISLAIWAKCSSRGSYCWSITNFSLATLTNSLVVGVPLLGAMYGPWASDLVVQLSVFQALSWLILLLFVLEVRKAGNSMMEVIKVANGSVNGHGETATKDPEAGQGTEVVVVLPSSRPSLCSLMKVVGLKLALNPNSYASIVGIIWAVVANRWHFELPGILDGCVQIMAKTGLGMAMFSMGLFMATQEKIISCGPSLTILGMALRFIAGPAAMAIGSIAVGLRGDVLRVVIIQAAVPQSITSFVYAREYGLHADVISTAVIFGMLVSLPVLISYYILLGFC
ncbi:Auxin efflux carrier component [Rhynchospora pubera]|uniref:Auxin efflux carrier component n=1 Tax=Rhynchospora pubera TaxID=906938 RepID=A0AAV8CTY5_9POAL|nr:Auxin efflux carrier component [Rhynchospora pubera]